MGQQQLLLHIVRPYQTLYNLTVPLKVVSRVAENRRSTSAFVDNRAWEQIFRGIYAKQYEYDSKPMAQQLNGQCIPSVYFSEIRKINNNKKFSSTPPFCFLPCVFFQYSCGSRTHKQRPYIVTSPENTYPVANTGKLRSTGPIG